MTTNNTMVMLTDGARKLYIESEGLLNFLELDDHVTIDNVMGYMSDTTTEELTDIFNYCIVGDNVPGYMVLGYYLDNHVTLETADAATIFVAIDEGQHSTITYYTPIGQHSEGAREYIEECTLITKEEYLNISKHIYTPAEYL